ncbi:MAG: hypothetical protein ACYC9X_00660 [Dehalococcoidia bacterium]
MSAIESPGRITLTERRASAVSKLWALGNLSWKFEARPTQKRLYDFIRSNWRRPPLTAICMHRRGGKSTIALAIALEEMLRRKNARVSVVAQSKENAEGIIDEVIEPLIADAPKGLIRKHKNKLIYSMDDLGSLMTVMPAAEAHQRKGRGRRNDFVFFDEAGFIENLGYLVRSVFGPSISEPTGKVMGSMLLSSTRPDEPEHDFDVLFERALLAGRGFLMPLSQNSDAVPAFVEHCAEECGGKETIEFRREYECEKLFDTSATVIPEATGDRIAGRDGRMALVRDVARPPWVDRYASLDPGVVDPTGHLWGFYLPEEDLIVIEEELFLQDMTPDKLAASINAKEASMWTGNELGRLYRYADPSDKTIIYDLGTDYKLYYQGTERHGKDAQIMRLRKTIREGRLAIHPRCVKLVKTLQIAKRASLRYKDNKFERMEEIGHADLLDCLLYMIRNINQSGNLAISPTQPRVAAPSAMTHGEPFARRPAEANPFARAFGLGRFRR